VIILFRSKNKKIKIFWSRENVSYFSQSFSIKNQTMTSELVLPKFNQVENEIKSDFNQSAKAKHFNRIMFILILT
jgi:hypothetical protein